MTKLWIVLLINLNTWNYQKNRKMSRKYANDNQNLQKRITFTFTDCVLRAWQSVCDDASIDHRWPLKLKLEQNARCCLSFTRRLRDDCRRPRRRFIICAPSPTCTLEVTRCELSRFINQVRFFIDWCLILWFTLHRLSHSMPTQLSS